jgi:hypothetical protein
MTFCGVAKKFLGEELFTLWREWRGAMTYQKLFHLKYRKRVSTYELVRRFPKEVRRIIDVALLEVPETTLKEVLPEKKAFERLMELKKKFLKEDPSGAREKTLQEVTI